MGEYEQQARGPKSREGPPSSKKYIYIIDMGAKYVMKGPKLY